MAIGKPNSKSGRFSTLSEINVTPLVDVMLVLLIVFMVSAPLMQQGVEVNLPRASNQALQTDDQPLVVSISSENKIEINGKRVAFEELKSQLSKQSQSHAQTVVVQADQSVSYGLVAKVMSKIRAAGLTKVGLVTAPE